MNYLSDADIDSEIAALQSDNEALEQELAEKKRLFDILGVKDEETAKKMRKIFDEHEAREAAAAAKLARSASKLPSFRAFCKDHGVYPGDVVLVRWQTGSQDAISVLVAGSDFDASSYGGLTPPSLQCFVALRLFHARASLGLDSNMLKRHVTVFTADNVKDLFEEATSDKVARKCFASDTMSVRRMKATMPSFAEYKRRLIADIVAAISENADLKDCDLTNGRRAAAAASSGYGEKAKSDPFWAPFSSTARSRTNQFEKEEEEEEPSTMEQSPIEEPEGGEEPVGEAPAAAQTGESASGPSSSDPTPSTAAAFALRAMNIRQRLLDLGDDVDVEEDESDDDVTFLGTVSRADREKELRKNAVVLEE